MLMGLKVVLFNLTLKALSIVSWNYKMRYKDNLKLMFLFDYRLFTGQMERMLTTLSHKWLKVVVLEVLSSWKDGNVILTFFFKCI